MLGAGWRLLLSRADHVVAVERQLASRCRRRASPPAAGTPSGWSSCACASRCGTARRRPACRRAAAPSTCWSVKRSFDQAAQHHDGAVVDHHGRLDRALVGRSGRRWRCRRDLRLTLETSWKISMRTVPPSPICGLMRSVRPTSLRSMVWNGLTRAGGAGVGELAGDERHVLADDDLGLLVVQREQVRRGQDVGVGLALQEARERSQRVHAADVRAAGRCSGPPTARRGGADRRRRWLRQVDDVRAADC